MNEIMKLMLPLNNKEKQAVKAHRILTHAYFTTSTYCPAAANLLLRNRFLIMGALPDGGHSKAYHVATKIEDLEWQHRCDEARAAGLR